MDPTLDPYDYSTEMLLRRKAAECAELRELLTAVAQELERACHHRRSRSRLLARAMRPRASSVECCPEGPASLKKRVLCGRRRPRPRSRPQ